MNLEIVAEALQFPEKKYINGIFLAVLAVEGKRRRERRTFAPAPKQPAQSAQSLSEPVAHAAMHCNENPIYVFQFWELRGHSPNFHIHVSVRDLYIPRIGPHISCSRIDRSIQGIYTVNRSQTHESGNWD